MASSPSGFQALHTVGDQALPYPECCKSQFRLAMRSARSRWSSAYSLRAADVLAAAEVRIGEPVGAAIFDQLARRQAGPVERLALEAGLGEDFFGIGCHLPLNGGASGKRENGDNDGVLHGSSFGC